jgi:hypothetical protein
LFWNPLQDSANRRQEAHIQHPVCFVKNQHLQTVHIGTTLLHQIKQAAWSCHDDIGTVSQRSNLWLHPDTTINHSRSHCRKRAVITETVVNLKCQFASACQNQHSHRSRQSRTIASTAVRSARRFRTAVQVVQQRQGECGRFAGSRLSNPDDVTTLQHCGNCLLLNWSWNAVTSLGHSAHKGLTKPQFTELHTPSFREKLKHSQVRRQKTVADRLTDIVRQPANSVTRLQSGHSSDSSTPDGHTGTSCGRYRSRFDHTWNWQSITGRKTTAGNALNASRIRPVKQNNTQPYWRQTAGLRQFQHFAKRPACPDKWPETEVYQSPLDGTEESLGRLGNSGIR